MTPTEPRFVIGVPTVLRPRDYLFRTIRSLASSISTGQRQRCSVVVLDADYPPGKNVHFRRLVRDHPELVHCGFLKPLALEKEHPVDESETVAPVDAPARHRRWLSKQVLDCACLMDRCRSLGDYYIHVEDDVVASPGFLSRVEQRLLRHMQRRTDWTVLSFYNSYPIDDDAQYTEHQLRNHYLGFIGQLIRCSELPRLASYLRDRCLEAPLDGLIPLYLLDRGGKVYAHSPSLFQHVGVVSSFEGRLQPWEAAEFAEGRRDRLRRRMATLRDVLASRPDALVAFFRSRLMLAAARRSMK